MLTLPSFGHTPFGHYLATGLLLVPSGSPSPHPRHGGDVSLARHYWLLLLPGSSLPSFFFRDRERCEADEKAEVSDLPLGIYHDVLVNCTPTSTLVDMQNFAGRPNPGERPKKRKGCLSNVGISLG